MGRSLLSKANEATAGAVHNDGLASEDDSSSVTSENNLTASYDSEKLQISLDDSASSSLNEDHDAAEEVEAHVDPGTLPDVVYERTMSQWRFAARRFAMQNLVAETEALASMQRKIRKPWLDTYFVYTSSLGTHTFFMVSLPVISFFGFQDVGRGLIIVLGMGVYFSSFIKDLVCAPRPYAPPVTRLTMGSHHLEYGFPSTHSTNSVSIALFIFSQIHASNNVSPLSYILSSAFLFFYAFSIVFGRLYTGMHSFTDCIVGVSLGTAVWAAHLLWWLPCEEWLIATHPSPIIMGLAPPTWIGALLVVIAGGIMVHRHPQPIDDCPCFEDAIAFVSVIGGAVVSFWAAAQAGYADNQLTSRMPGSPFLTTDAHAWTHVVFWWGTAVGKLVVGVSIVFIWRLFAKSVLRFTLPRLFRFISYKILPLLVSIHVLAPGAELPNRRFYTPATEYAGNVPMGSAEDRDHDGHMGGMGGLRSIPSVIDLPGSMREGEYYTSSHIVGKESSDVGMTRRKGPLPKSPLSSGTESDKTPLPANTTAPKAMEDAKADVVKHYDADVLTKVVVYGGIGALACEGIPVLFEFLGWGLHL